MLVRLQTVGEGRGLIVDRTVGPGRFRLWTSAYSPKGTEMVDVGSSKDRHACLDGPAPHCQLLLHVPVACAATAAEAPNLSQQRFEV